MTTNTGRWYQDFIFKNTNKTTGQKIPHATNVHCYKQLLIC